AGGRRQRRCRRTATAAARRRPGRLATRTAPAVGRRSRRPRPPPWRHRAGVVPSLEASGPPSPRTPLVGSTLTQARGGTNSPGFFWRGEAALPGGPMSFLSNYRVVLLDMNGTFMFGHDRLGPGEDFHATYATLGGTRLGPDEVRRVVLTCCGSVAEALAAA